MLKRQQLGVTLVELIVVVAIVAILAALAVPNFRDYFERARLRGASDAAIALMANSRVEAVKRDRGVAILVGGTAAAWCIGANIAADPAGVGDPIPAPATCDCSVAATCQVGEAPSVVAGALFKGVSVSAVGVGVNFDSKLGMLDIGAITGFAEPSVTFNSASNRFALRVTVSALGHVRACVPVGKLPIPGYAGC